MMKFMDYMKLSSLDDDEAVFRSIEIGLVESPTKYHNCISNVSENHPEVLSLFIIKKKLNDQLKKRYNGKYLFDFCIDESVSIDTLKIKDSYKKFLSLSFFESNDDITKIKTIVEKHLK